MHKPKLPESILAQRLEQKPELNHVIFAGTFIIAFFIACLAGWTAFAPLHSAAIAPGYITVDKGRKTIAHLEGGIVGELLTSEGDQVKAGQLLIRLSDTNANATLDLLRSRHLVARALEARLESEYEGLTEIRFPADLAEQRDDAIANEILSNQEKIFETRHLAIENRKDILKQRIVQLQEEISGLKEQIKAEEGQLALIEEEVDLLQKMLKKGLTEKPRLLMMQRRAFEIQGQRSMHQSQIARAQQSIGETQLRISEIYATQTSEVAEQLRTARADIYDLNERIRAAEDVQNRTDIVSPINGTVVGLRINTPGGIIRPGEPLMDIVPLNERLVVEARVEPSDIDIVSKGMQAKVRLTAFSQRLTPPEIGQVESLSADHLVDEATGKTYYLARIALTNNDIQLGEKKALRPGMETEVMIDAGARTFMEYMLEPLLRSFNRAFRES